MIVPLAGTTIADETRLLQLVHAVPPALAETAETVQSVYRDYRELSLLRTGLKRIYILTLTLTLLLALFFAIALAFILSRRLSEPLAELAESTHAVARGDFSRRPRVTSRDELGVLTRSFNSMIGQLDDARAAAEENRSQLENANVYLQSILANLSAGVLMFDESFRLQVANAGAARILGEDLGTCAGGPLAGSPAFDTLARAIREGFADAAADAPWQRQLEVGVRGLTLLVRGSRLPRRRRLRRRVRRRDASSSPRSGRPPGPRSRAGSRTRSRTRSRRSSSRPSGCRRSSPTASRRRSGRRWRARPRPSSTRSRR